MRTFILFLFLFSGLLTHAQSDTIILRNPSFEDTPRRGGGPFSGIKGWFDCGRINFPDETPPDIHPKNFWGNTKHAEHGRTYLGMVVRDNDSYECVSQKLDNELIGDQCYSFSISLARSERYVSGSKLYKDVDGKYNYTTPAVLRVWGGTGYCDERELLAETVVIDHSPWKTYTMKLSPTINHKSISLQVYYKVPIIIPYNGHILVDNCSALVPVECDEDLVVVEEPKTNIPFHKKKKKKTKKKKAKKQDVVDSEQNSVPVKKVMNLDRNKLQKGQTIEIQNLYFKADAVDIDQVSHEVLDEIFEFLNDNEDITVEIGGHTNGTPSHEYCDQLSTERAKAVAVYLVEKGIEGDRIYYKGYGKRKAIASNRTKEGRKKNQRVEIKILSIG